MVGHVLLTSVKSNGLYCCSNKLAAATYALKTVYRASSVV